jgi:hypothetical protein
MTFQELLNSQVFFNTFIKNDTFFGSIKDKFPEILADLTSARNNPNCSCKGRVRAHLQSKLTIEADYFNNLINNEEIKKLIQENAEEIKNSQIPNNAMEAMQQNIFKNSGGKIFEIGKTEEDWKNLAKKITEEKIFFRSFSVVEREDKLVVYFI